MVSFVKNVIAEEELYREPSQKLLIINRFPLGVFLNLTLNIEDMVASASAN